MRRKKGAMRFAVVKYEHSVFVRKGDGAGGVSVYAWKPRVVSTHPTPAWANVYMHEAHNAARLVNAGAVTVSFRVAEIIRRPKNGVAVVCDVVWGLEGFVSGDSVYEVEMREKQNVCLY